MNYKLPEELVVVLHKMCPEIDEIEIYDTQEHKVYDPYTFDSESKFLVVIDIRIKNGFQISGNKEYYETIINDYFKMIFTKHEFIVFSVNQLLLPPEKTKKEIFEELFSE